MSIFPKYPLMWQMGNLGQIYPIFMQIYISWSVLRIFLKRFSVVMKDNWGTKVTLVNFPKKPLFCGQWAIWAQFYRNYAARYIISIVRILLKHFTVIKDNRCTKVTINFLKNFPILGQTSIFGPIWYETTQPSFLEWLEKVVLVNFP